MLKTLLKSVRQYKLDTALTPVFMLFEVIFEVLLPFLMAALIDKGIEAGDMSYIGRMSFVLIGVAILAMVAGILSGSFAASASAGFARNLRKDIYYNVQTFSFANIDKFSTASLVTRLTTDITNVQNAYQMVIRMAVRAPVTLILAFIMVLRVNAQLSLIFLAAIPVLGGGLYLITSRVHPIFRKVFNTYDKLNNRVRENLRGIRVVKNYVRDEYEEEKFGTVSQVIYNDFSKAEKRLAFNAPLMQLCMYASMILISWFGAKLIVSGGMTTGELMSVITYAMQILMSLMMLSMVYVMVVISRASTERIAEVLVEKADLTNGPVPVHEVKDGSIVFKNVDFSYAKDKNKLCLFDVDITINSGETIGILGGTGSSKTTLVQLIPRLYDATGGQILVGGVDVRDYDLDALRNQVAVVLQKNLLFSGTIRDNLRWGKEDASDDELIHACELAQADGFIREFPNGYETHIEQGGANVSGGQRQRLCIARALLKKPKILILDDSTSAVDMKTDAAIRKAFREEIPDTTKLIIAQRVASVQEADRIIVMEGGRVAAFGTHEELLEQSEIYREVFESQTSGGDFDDEN